MQRLEALRLGHQQRGRLVRPDDARGMRVEGHRHRRAAVFGGAAFHAIDDLLMSAVQAVEVAEGQDRVDEPRGPGVVGEVNGLHSLHVDGHVEHEPIICQFNARGQARAGRRVAEVVRHVRQVGAARLDPRDDLERLGDGEVRGVRFVAQRVDDQRLNAVDERQAASSRRLQSVR